MQFTESKHCLDRVHCGRCRNKDGGRALRASFGKVYALPGGLVDFECPHGLAWGYAAPVTPSQAQQRRKEWLASLSPEELEQMKREARHGCCDPPLPD